MNLHPHLNLRQRVRRATAVTIDREAIILAAIFMVVMIPAVAVTVAIPMDVQPNAFGLEGVALGGAWALGEVVVAALLVGLIFIFNRLPEWIQNWAKLSGAVGALLWGGGFLQRLGLLWQMIGGLFVITFIFDALDEYNLWWIMNNLLALTIAILFAPAGAWLFGVKALLVALVGLSIYDWYFADRNEWMFSLASVLMKSYAPVLFIIPTGLRVDWKLLTDPDEDDFPEGVESASDMDEEQRLKFKRRVGFSMGIGTADLLLPAMFASAVAASPSVLSIHGVPAGVLGVAVGVIVAALRIRWKIIEHKRGAGLPPLATGAILGYVPFALLAWVVAHL